MARLLLLIPLLLAYFVGCKSGCDGVEVNGRCETECKDELCKSGFLCFQNACREVCTTSDDCSGGLTCERTVSDSGTKGLLCVSRTGETPSPTAGTSGPCTASNECASEYGYRCVEGECTFTCETHAQCGESGSCSKVAKDTEKSSVHVCAKDEFPRGKGQFGSACPNGDECDAENGFTCITAGPGDIDAFCTQQFCKDDSGCPTGYYCSASRSRALPCDDACGIAGSNTDDCIAASDIGKGKHYECGPVSLTTTLCLLRDFCNTCDTDADCLGKPNQICAKDESGAKICTVLCDSDVNSCPWGSAANCGLWDSAVGKPTCSHRFGSCTGDGKSCEPCVEQTDCPLGFCAETQFTGERYCVDMSVSCSCPEGTKGACSGGGCPKTPAGKPLTCLGGSDYKDSPLVGKCVGAETDSQSTSSRQGCWPSL